VDRRVSQTLITAVLVIAAILIVFVFSDRGGVGLHNPPAIPGADEHPENSVHLLLGNPSRATDDPPNANNFLMRKPYYALSYNSSKGTPNWVSWRLQESDLGDAPRPQFYPDESLPRSFRPVTPHDYTGTGFDRGHMCPHGDRAGTQDGSNATFAMTNIIPQAPNVNKKAWNDFEEYCREMARRRRQTLYIVSGPQGKGGEGSRGPADAIAGGHVTVPAKCWKVAVIVDGDSGPDDLAKIGPRTRVIGVVMPNEESVGYGWAKYRTSVREIETLTGYTFFDRIPHDIADALKTKVDNEHIPPPRPRRSGD
jgi:endonuclease G, mitochondrial